VTDERQMMVVVDTLGRLASQQDVLMQILENQQSAIRVLNGRIDALEIMLGLREGGDDGETS